MSKAPTVYCPNCGEESPAEGRCRTCRTLMPVECPECNFPVLRVKRYAYHGRTLTAYFHENGQCFR